MLVYFTVAKQTFSWSDVISNLDLIIVNLSNISIKIFELKENLEEPTKISSNIALIENLTIIQDKIVSITGVARSAREYARAQSRTSSQLRELLDLDSFGKELLYIITNGNVLHDLIQKHIIQDLNSVMSLDIKISIDSMNKYFKKSLEDIRRVYLIIHYINSN